MSEAYTNRQLALKLAVEAYGDSAWREHLNIERLADKFERYLETGTMGR